MLFRHLSVKTLKHRVQNSNSVSDFTPLLVETQRKKRGYVGEFRNSGEVTELAGNLGGVPLPLSPNSQGEFTPAPLKVWCFILL